ncbi:MAG TPA: hypothetical protein PK264_09630 [Hyphomicrobiaceae bacterium]|nr:hypothetical protein [Hyphomicrobiaceae bacterium]
MPGAAKTGETTSEALGARTKCTLDERLSLSSLPEVITDPAIPRPPMPSEILSYINDHLIELKHLADSLRAVPLAEAIDAAQNEAFRAAVMQKLLKR